MYFSFKGTIKHLTDNYIALEVNSITYQIYVSKPNNYKIGSIYTIYIYQVIREDECYFIGFSSLEERHTFLILLKVNGIGPKTALGILRYANTSEIINAIKSNNINYLRRIPGVGIKGAQQILLDLRGTLNIKNINPHQYDEVKATLKGLNFSSKEIDNVLVGISIPGATNDDILQEALKRLNPKYVRTQ